jgi:hypothetical protein
MNEKLSNVLAELAEKFGTTVEHLWGVLLRQAMVSGVMHAVNIVFILIAVYAFYRYFRWWGAKDKKGDMDEVGHPIILGLGGLTLAIVVFLGLPSELYWAVTAFTNPEYWALNQIVH